MTEPNESAEPVGWAVISDGVASRFAGSFLTLANTATQHDEIVALYRSPKLTDEEREAIRSACKSVKMVGTEKCFTTLLGLLERLA